MSKPTSLLTLPRELRDEIITHLILPAFVYTSSSKPNTANLHRTATDAQPYVDTRIHLPSRIAPNILGVCRQLRSECLQLHNHIIASLSSDSPPLSPPLSETRPPSWHLAERLGTGADEEAERLNDVGIRITLEVQRAQRGRFGYATPVREDLSPRFLALLPLLQGTRKLRLVVWPGFDWWNGSRPRTTKMVNGRMRIDDAAPQKPDAVSFAVAKVLEKLTEVEDLEIDVLAHVGDISRWDLPDTVWEGVQYWLDDFVVQEGGRNLKKVVRRLAGVWKQDLIEASYVQEETRIGEGGKHGTWRVKRKGDMRTPKIVAMADPGELDGYPEPVDEEFERTV
ncbi:hypothetical protein BKA63DRAFT_125436 [Paraphoma chrysanthemicola]|nr:hypothetical protein BKA63DRAFT_125436 [Paraphoma chrysanthemicola]